MKVLHLVKTSVGANWALLQMEALRELGLEIEVVLPFPGIMSERYRERRIPIHYLQIDIARLKAPLTFYRAAAAFRDLIQLLEPDLIHSHFVGTTLFSRLALGHSHPIPRVFQVPGPLHLQSFATRRAEILTAGPNDYWLASCKLTYKIYLGEGVGANRVGISYYGTDTVKFAQGRRFVLRSSLGSLANATLIGMVSYAYKPKKWLGQMRGLKGHEDMIDAGRILLDRGHDIAVIFAGGPWPGSERYFEKIKRYAYCRLGKRCVFLGHRGDVPDVYADLDVAVHPSLSENLGGAAESLLAGVPTVATDVGGFPDIVIEGETGRLCLPGNPESLARAIEAMLRRPIEARSMALEGQEYAGSLLDVKKTARTVCDFYQEVLKKTA